MIPEREEFAGATNLCGHERRHGLIGVTLDPNFNANQYIYLYYSPPVDKEPLFLTFHDLL